MRSKSVDKFRQLSALQRNAFCLMIGVFFGLILGLIHPFLSHICGLKIEIGESFIAFWPVITCLVASFLQTERNLIVLACAGAAMSSSLPYYGSFSGILTVFSAFCGACLGALLYYGRGDSWPSCILRSLCFMPVFYVALWNWDGKPLWFGIMLFVLGLICFLLTGQKNALKVRSLIVQGVSILLATTFPFRIIMMFVFYLAHPNYYP